MKLPLMGECPSIKIIQQLWLRVWKMCAKEYLWPYGFGISLNDPDGGHVPYLHWWAVEMEYFHLAAMLSPVFGGQRLLIDVHGLTIMFSIAIQPTPRLPTKNRVKIRPYEKWLLLDENRFDMDKPLLAVNVQRQWLIIQVFCGLKMPERSRLHGLFAGFMFVSTSIGCKLIGKAPKDGGCYLSLLWGTKKLRFLL